MLEKYSVTHNDENNYNINFSKKRLTGIHMHIHDYYELELVLSGKGRTTINGNEFKAKKGSVFLLTPSDVHNYTADEELFIACLSFTPDLIEYSLFLEMLYPMKCVAGTVSNEKLETLVFYCEQLSRVTKSSVKFADKYISLLLTCVLIELDNIETENMINTEMLPYSYSPVLKAIWYINSNFKKDITLDDVANYVGITSSSLGKKFTKYCNISYKEYLINIRLQYAKSLIIHTNETLTNIAYYSGFNSLSYFQKVFSNKYGISPNSIRKKGISQ